MTEQATTETPPTEQPAHIYAGSRPCPSRMLPVKLTDEEVLATAREGAAVHAQIEALDDEKKTATRQYTDALKAKRAQLKGLQTTVTTGFAERMVDCEQRDVCEPLWEVHTVRKDTGEVIDLQPMPDGIRRKYIEPELPLRAPKSADGATGEQATTYPDPEKARKALEAMDEADRSLFAEARAALYLPEQLLGAHLERVGAAWGTSTGGYKSVKAYVDVRREQLSGVPVEAAIEKLADRKKSALERVKALFEAVGLDPFPPLAAERAEPRMGESVDLSGDGESDGDGSEDGDGQGDGEDPGTRRSATDVAEKNRQEREATYDRLIAEATKRSPVDRDVVGELIARFGLSDGCVRKVLVKRGRFTAERVPGVGVVYTAPGAKAPAPPPPPKTTTKRRVSVGQLTEAMGHRRHQRKR